VPLRRVSHEGRPQLHLLHEPRVRPARQRVDGDPPRGPRAAPAAPGRGAPLEGRRGGGQRPHRRQDRHPEGREGLHLRGRPHLLPLLGHVPRALSRLGMRTRFGCGAAKQDRAALSRRSFAFGISALAGGLVLGTPAAFAQGKVQAPATAKPGRPELTAWVVIEPADTGLIRSARAEMRQGIFTSLPMLVAEELECDWARVKPEYAPVAEHLARKRVWGNMVTTDSVSVRRSHDYLRKAGAQTRMMLIAEAAARWNCPTEECTARNSVVRHGASGRTLRYGALAH